MQMGRDTNIMISNVQSGGDQNQRLRERKVRDLMADKRRLVEVPYTATLAHTMNVLVANRVVSAPVAAPPGHWIGAGGSMIMESDKQTGAVRKHYIGMVTMLDILAHIAGDVDDDEMEGGDHRGSDDLDRRMSVTVSAIIGHCLESLSLWTLNPNTSILDCMEVFSKGIHRALVPLDSHMENIAGVELVESASCYRMVTQMDLVRFLKEHDDELKEVLSRSVTELGAITENVFGVGSRTRVIHAIKSMRAGSLQAVPIVEASTSSNEDHSKLIYGRGRKLIGTFSATDLRECPVAQLQSWLSLSVMDFTERPATSPGTGADPEVQGTPRRELVTCYGNSQLSEVIEKAITKHVHRVWVVDQVGMLEGLVSLTDMIRVIRTFLQLSES